MCIAIAVGFLPPWGEYLSLGNTPACFPALSILPPHPNRPDGPDANTPRARMLTTKCLPTRLETRVAYPAADPAKTRLMVARDQVPAYPARDPAKTLVAYPAGDPPRTPRARLTAARDQVTAYPATGPAKTRVAYPAGDPAKTPRAFRPHAPGTSSEPPQGPAQVLAYPPALRRPQGAG